MRIFQWIASHWFIGLGIGILLLSIYFSILAFRTLQPGSSLPSPDQLSNEEATKWRSIINKVRPLLTLIAFIALLSIMIFSIVKNQPSPPISNSKYSLITGEYGIKINILETADYGDVLRIRFDEFIPVNDSTYKVSFTISFKDGSEKVQIKNAKEGAILTYPPEGGYDIRILQANATSLNLAIKKSDP